MRSTNNSRPITADESAEFAASVATNRMPLKSVDRQPPSGRISTNQRHRKPRAQGAVTGLSGMDRRTAQRLQAGAMQPQAKLDLHNFTLEEARRALDEFVGDGLARGLRLLLIITGKGLRPQVLRDTTGVQQSEKCYRVGWNIRTTVRMWYDATRPIPGMAAPAPTTFT